MFLFHKKEYKTVELKLKSGQLDEDMESGSVSLEACGIVDNEEIYCYAAYITQGKNYDNGVFDEMLNILRNNNGAKFKVRLIYRNGKLMDFRIDLTSLSEILNYAEIQKLEIIAWGLNRKSAFD